MNKIAVQNLGMILSNKCNLNCEHCLRGEKNNDIMSSEVIDATLDQIKGIGNLCICGGEPTLALDVLEELLEKIIEKEIYITMLSTVINGTIYSEKFLQLLDKFNEYISRSTKDNKVIFNISYDKYHVKEMKKLNIYEEYLNNIIEYKKSKYFGYFNILDPKLKLYRCGNAKNLPEELTVPLKQLYIYLTYVNNKRKFDKYGLCNIGPLITVNTKGIVTECDASLIEQETIYNYGNVLEGSIESIALSRGKVLKPRKWDRMTAKEMKDYKTYNE